MFLLKDMLQKSFCFSKDLNKISARFLKNVFSMQVDVISF